MPVFFVLIFIAFSFATNCPVAVDSYRLIPGWQLRASARLPPGLAMRCQPGMQLRFTQTDGDGGLGSIDASSVAPELSGVTADRTEPTKHSDVTLVSAPEFAGIDSEDFYDYNDEDSDDEAGEHITGTDEYVSPNTKFYKAELERKHDLLMAQEKALKETEERLATEYELLKKLLTLRDRGEFVHDDLRAKEEVCKGEEARSAELRNLIRRMSRKIEEIEWRLEQSRDADEEKNVLRRRKRLRQELMALAERDVWLGIDDENEDTPDPTQASASLAAAPVGTEVGTPPAAQAAGADITVPASAVAVEPVTAEEAAPAPVDQKVPNRPALEANWDWQAVRSWDETTASATAVDAGWVALRSAVLLSLGLVDVATGYVTSTEVAEVVQAVVGTGASLVDIAQSAGDAWHSGAEVWKMQVTDSLDAQSSVKDVILSTCLGAKEVLCSPPVRKALGNIGKTVATTATSVVTSGVHTSERVRREFERSVQWNKGIMGLKASVPLLCALCAAGVVKSVEEVMKSMS